MEGRSNKMVKLEEKEDRISELPDPLLQRIISFLPSTEEAARTCVLSKRWRNQWTRIPVLVFDFRSGMSNSLENLIRFIGITLVHRGGFKIKKLHLAYDFSMDADFSSKIQFAMRNHVEDLILDCCSDFDDPYLLTKSDFDFQSTSLIKLDMTNCYLGGDDFTVNWGSLKAFRFKMAGSGSNQRDFVSKVLYGSPLLESLELDALGEGNYAIDSKSLKTLTLVEVYIESNDYIKISCPNLEDFILLSSEYKSYASLPDETIKNVISGCPLLRSLELKSCTFYRLVIASQSLKRLVLRNLDGDCVRKISCPNIEELIFNGFLSDTVSMSHFPSLVCATLDFDIPPIEDFSSIHVVSEIICRLKDVKELSMGDTYLEVLSEVDTREATFPWLNNKILTVHDPYFHNLGGIVCAIRSSPMLEELVINLRLNPHENYMSNAEERNQWIKKNYCNPNETVFNCSVSNLKNVKIVGLSDRDDKHKLVLNFVEFLLKNGGGIEKIVVILTDYEKGFLLQVAQKLLSFQRCFPNTTIELLCSN